MPKLRILVEGVNGGQINSLEFPWPGGLRLSV